MEKKIHLYVSRKNPLTWMMLICMLSSIAMRFFVFGFGGAGNVSFWNQIVLPIAATVLYLLFAFVCGEEAFYKTAVPVWMMAASCALWTMRNIPVKLIVWLIWIALAFLAFLYTDITAGKRQKSVWLLFPLLLMTIGTVLYVHKSAVLSLRWEELRLITPDLLALSGALLICFAIRIHPAGEYHRSWGDRSDGRRIRTLAPMDMVSPYIMVERNAATNSFEESFEISNLDHYIRQKRREGLANFGIMHIFLAAYCRSLAKYPALNRFISGQKVYTHGEDVQFCLTIKKEMSTRSPETIVKVHLSPRDTVYDVYRKVNDEIEKAKDAPLDSAFDKTAHAFILIPGIFLKFFVWSLKTMDYFGLIPAFLLEISPFHGSIYFTSMGSLGIPPIYHHLYDFGNLPVFCAFGCKRRANELQDDGTIVRRKYVDFKFSLDERIVDGYYYAAFFKHYRRIIAHPEVLNNPPEEVMADID